MAKLTPAVALKRWHKAARAHRAAMDAVYKSAPRRDIPFSKCLEMAPQDVKALYERTRREELDARYAGHSAGVWHIDSNRRMWWTSRGRSGEVETYV